MMNCSENSYLHTHTYRCVCEYMYLWNYAGLIDPISIYRESILVDHITLYKSSSYILCTYDAWRMKNLHKINNKRVIK